jgi:hypothetical protein
MEAERRKFAESLRLVASRPKNRGNEP